MVKRREAKPFCRICGSNINKIVNGVCARKKSCRAQVPVIPKPVKPVELKPVKLEPVDVDFFIPDEKRRQTGGGRRVIRSPRGLS